MPSLMKIKGAGGGTFEVLENTPGAVTVELDGVKVLQEREAAIASLTDNSGGTANDTLVAISAAYVQAEVQDNFADLAAKVNAILVALRNHGIIAT